jgi:hypothetical protein
MRQLVGRSREEESREEELPLRDDAIADGRVSRARPWTLVTVAGVAGVALAGGYVWTTTTADPGGGSESRSLPGVVACAETIAVGNVTSVSRMTSVSRQGDRFTVRLDAVRYLKPGDGPAVFSAGGARLFLGGAGADPVEGGRALLVVHDAGDVDLFTGADIDSEWAWMERALPDSRSIDPRECTHE